MEVTKVFNKNVQALLDKNRVIVNMGGSSSSKTISVMQLFRILAENEENLYFLLIARSVPKLKTTLLKDFKNIIMGDDYDSKRFHKDDKEYTFDSGSVFKFANAYDEDTYKGVRSDYALLDECNTYRNGKGVFNQIEIRLKYTIFPTFNPTSKFWITDVLERDDCVSIHSTYKDNQFTEESIIRSLESRIDTDPQFYKVFVLGKWGALEGLIFKEGQDWERCDKMPTEYDYKFYGLDFGFNHDTCLTESIIDGEYLYTRVVFSMPELYTADIVRLIKEQNISGNYIVGDSTSGTNMVKELQAHGIAIVPAIKGPDSVMFGINKLKSFKMWYILETSTELIKDLDNYSYMLDAEGNAMNVPDKKTYDPDKIDSARYSVSRFNTN